MNNVSHTLNKISLNSTSFSSIYNQLKSGFSLKVTKGCYICNGYGSHREPYDIEKDARGCYDYEGASPLKEIECSQCNGTGKIEFIFNTPKDLIEWIKNRLVSQDWTFDYSEDVDVKVKEYFYQEITQELLWLIPSKTTEYLIHKYQSNVDPLHITISRYKCNFQNNAYSSLSYILFNKKEIIT